MSTEIKPAPRTVNLFVIDDHPLMREAVVMLLRRLRPGANVVELERLGGVNAAVRQHGKPDLICLDLKLPDTTGTSGIHELKKLFPETPLAVLSASPASDSEECCSEAGADVYIVSRLAAILGHPVTLASRPGRGTVFRLVLKPTDAREAAERVAAVADQLVSMP